ncbi:MAG: hypothetical protein WEA24_12000 [Gemmatimonadota bacterium]
MSLHGSVRAAPLALLATVFLYAPPLAAQETPDSVRVEMARLRARLDSLEILVRRLQAEGREPEAQDALARLREAAAAAAGSARADSAAGADAAAPVSASRQRSLQALNPEISINADILGHLDPDNANGNNFIPREFEFSFQSALDPYSRAKIFLAHHTHGPELVAFPEEEGGEEEEGGLEIEEGYVEWVGLPAGVGLKLGKFFQRFGALNRWHEHALPFQNRSLPHQAFIGEEGLSQAGASLNWILPVHGLGAYDATVEVTRSSNEPLFGTNNELSYLGHLNGFWELGAASDVDLGVSWLHGRYEDDVVAMDRDLVGVEAAYTWRPPARSRYRELVVRGGATVLDGLVPDEAAAADDRAVGLWSLAELRLNQRWLVGGRVDRVENPLDTSESAWLASTTLTWWQSEYVRLRLEYDLLGRSFMEDDDGRLWFQVTFAMGPHKHETY